MDKLKEVLAAMKALTGEMDALEAKRATEKDESTLAIITEEFEAKTIAFDKLQLEAEKVKKDIKRQELVAELNEMEAKAHNLVDVKVEKTTHNEGNWQRERDTASVKYLIEGKSALAEFAAGNDNLMDAVRPKDSDREGIVAPSYIRDHILSNRFVGKTEYPVLTSDASGSQSGGGSLVPDTFITELYKIPQITDRMVEKCYVKRAIGGSALFPRLTQSTNPFGVAVTWGTEGAAMTESDPVFNQLSISTNRLTGLAYASEKELRVNAVGLEAELATMFRGAIDRAQTVAILRGNGSGQPSGINTNPQIVLGVNVVERETAGTVTYTDLSNLQYAIASGAMENGMFIISTGATGAMKYIAGLNDSDGRPVVRTFWQDGMANAMLGSPYMATPGNAVVLGGRGDVVYGDMRQYGVAVDQEVTIARSDDYKFNQGVVTFRVMTYFGGAPLGCDCFAVLGDAAAVSSSSSSST